MGRGAVRVDEGVRGKRDGSGHAEAGSRDKRDSRGRDGGSKCSGKHALGF